MTDKKTYPEFVKLILALQDAELYEQAKICVKALYELERKDKRIVELDDENKKLSALYWQYAGEAASIKSALKWRGAEYVYKVMGWIK